MHVAVLVPYRDEPRQNRAAHLAAFRKHMPAVLDGALGAGNWSIHIGVQTDDGHKFARGRVLNALVRIVQEKAPETTRLVFHDVDLLPDVARAAGYAQPLSYDTAIMALNTTGEYASLAQYIGGICAMDMATFVRVDGFPNQLEGWGAEDDALRSRLPPRCIRTYTAGSVRNLELEGAGFVRARDADEFKMPKDDRRRVKDLWRNGDSAITGFSGLVFGGKRRASEAPAEHVYDLDVFGWETAVSKSTGKTYYVHAASKTSQWEPPLHI